MGPIVIIYNETHQIDSERNLSNYLRNDVTSIWACLVIYPMNACSPSLKTLIVLHPTSSNLNRACYLYHLRIELSLPLRVFHLTQSQGY